MKKDVLLLADVFEKFIDMCVKFYGLDPCHYFSSPELIWDVMLKMTEIELEKISDIGKYLFIEKGLRGGISYIAKRYAKANNKYLYSSKYFYSTTKNGKIGDDGKISDGHISVKDYLTCKKNFG